MDIDCVVTIFPGPFRYSAGGSSTSPELIAVVQQLDVYSIFMEKLDSGASRTATQSNYLVMAR